MKALLILFLGLGLGIMLGGIYLKDVSPTLVIIIGASTIGIGLTLKVFSHEVRPSAKPIEES